MSQQLPGGRTALESPAGTDYFEAGRGIVALWFGLLAGPLAWFLHLNVSYSLVRLICLQGGRGLIEIATLTSLLLAAAGVWVALRSWRRIGRPEVTTGSGSFGRSRFMAAGGLGLSGFFFLVILVAWLPGLFLNPCPGGL